VEELVGENFCGGEGQNFGGVNFVTRGRRGILRGQELQDVARRQGAPDRAQARREHSAPQGRVTVSELLNELLTDGDSKKKFLEELKGALGQKEKRFRPTVPLNIEPFKEGGEVRWDQWLGKLEDWFTTEGLEVDEKKKAFLFGNLHGTLYKKCRDLRLKPYDDITRELSQRMLVTWTTSSPTPTSGT
jgi:hypothetical protein